MTVDRLYRRRAIINNPELLRRAAHLAIDLDCARFEVIEKALREGLGMLELAVNAAQRALEERGDASEKTDRDSDG